MGKSKRIAINIVAQLFSFVVGLGVSFVLTPYITARLGKDVYGFVGMAYQVTSYISVFSVAFNAMLNIFVATNYHKKEFAKSNEYLSSVMIIDCLLAVILFLPFTVIALFMNKVLDVPLGSMQDIKLLWFIVFVTFLLNLAFGPLGCGLYIKNRLDLQAKRSLESNFIRASLLLTSFCFLLPKVWYIGFASFASTIFFIVTNYYYFKKFTPELKVSRLYFKWKAVKELLTIGVWNTVNQLTNILVSGLDLVVTNLFISALAMGYISYAQTVPIQMLSLITMISGSFSPVLNKTYAIGTKEEFNNEIVSAIKTCGFLCSIPILGFIVFGRAFYKLWLPTLTVDEVNTINVLSFLILFHTIFDVYMYPLYSVQAIMKKIKMPVLVSFGTSLLNIMFELLLLKYSKFGVYSIEIATAVLSFVRVMVFTPIYSAYILQEKWYKFYKPIFKGVISSVLILTLFSFMYYFIPIHSWIMLIVVALIAGVIGYVTNYFVVLSKIDREKIKLLFRQKIENIKIFQ